MADTRPPVQVGLVLQRGKKIRAGCRFALRMAETPEEIAALWTERAETGIEWTKYEVPDDIELDRDAYPGLLMAASSSSDGGSGAGMGAGVGASGSSNGGVPMLEAGSVDVDADGGWGGGGGEVGDVLSTLYVALQGWVKLDVDDPEVGFRQRVAGGVAAGSDRMYVQVRGRCYGRRGRGVGVGVMFVTFASPPCLTSGC